jgi:D-glycero-alpha-D-manno-heptose-7-phosphate kinase
LTWREKEVVEHRKDLKHDLVREALTEFPDFESGIEIIFIADIPGVGSGLGSSAATMVSLLHALLILKGWEDKEIDRRWLADMAANIQINRLRSPQGRQDEYASSIGGLMRIDFSNRQASVERTRTIFEPGNIHKPKILGEFFSLFSPRGNVGRSSNEVLNSFKDDVGFRKECTSIVDRFETILVEQDWERLHPFLSQHHELKSRYFSTFAPTLDSSYLEGNTKFKLCGAGRTGHLLVGVTPSTRCEIRARLEKCWGPELPFRFVPYGSTLVYQE